MYRGAHWRICPTTVMMATAASMLAIEPFWSVSDQLTIDQQRLVKSLIHERRGAETSTWSPPAEETDMAL